MFSLWTAAISSSKTTKQLHCFTPQVRQATLRSCRNCASDGTSWQKPSNKNLVSYGYGSIPIYIPFLGGWTSIYQLFWCSPGVQGFDTLPYLPYDLCIDLWCENFIYHTIRHYHHLWYIVIYPKKSSLRSFSKKSPRNSRSLGANWMPSRRWVAMAVNVWRPLPFRPSSSAWLRNKAPILKRPVGHEVTIMAFPVGKPKMLSKYLSYLDLFSCSVNWGKKNINWRV